MTPDADGTAVSWAEPGEAEPPSTVRMSLAGEGDAVATLRELAPPDLDGVVRFHREVIASLDDPASMYPRDRGFFADVLGGRGRLAGGFHDGRLIAYATLRLPRGPEAWLAQPLSLPEAECGVVAQFEGSAVHPIYRGHALQYHLNAWRVRFARDAGARHALALVSPTSPFSLRSHLRHGLRVAGVYVDRDGPNFLVHRDLHAPATPPRPIERAPLTDFERHRDLLRRGLRGVALARDAAGFHVDYAG